MAEPRRQRGAPLPHDADGLRHRGTGHGDAAGDHERRRRGELPGEDGDGPDRVHGQAPRQRLTRRGVAGRRPRGHHDEQQQRHHVADATDADDRVQAAQVAHEHTRTASVTCSRASGTYITGRYGNGPQGVLDRVGGPVRAERLVPFVGPRHCELHLSGGSLVLVAPHAPRPLLAQLAERAPVDVEYLVEGPEAWHVRITRRPVS